MSSSRAWLLLLGVLTSPVLAAVPTGFQETVYSSPALTPATGLAWAPDGSGRLFIINKNGGVLVATMRDGALVTQGASLATAVFASETVYTASECGLLGIAFDPNYTVNRYVYLFVTASSSKQQIVRYTDSNGVGTARTVVVDNLPTAGQNHDGGALGFGLDGKLYWAIGDLGNGTGAGGATLTFTRVNWSTPRSVTVAAAQDADTVRDFATLTLAAAGGDARTVSVTALDDDSLAPSIVSTPPTSAVVGAAYLYEVVADGLPAPAFSLTSSVQGPSIDARSGVLTWTPAAVGAVDMTVLASNGEGPDATQSFQVLVKADAPPRAVLTRPLEGERVSGATAEFFGDCVDDVGCTRAEFYVDGVLGSTDARGSGVQVCVGDAACVPPGPGDGGTEPPVEGSEGCGCGAGPGGALAWLGLLVVLLARARPDSQTLKGAVLLLLLFAASPAGAGDRRACTEADLASAERVFEGRVVSLHHELKWTEATLVVTKVLQGEVGKRVKVHINIPRRRELTLTRGARYRLHATATGQDTPWVLCGQRLTRRGKAG